MMILSNFVNQKVKMYAENKLSRVCPDIIDGDYFPV